MNRQQLIERIDDLLKACAEGKDNPNRVDPFLPFTGALTLMSSLYGEGSPQVGALVGRRKEIYSQKVGSERLVWGPALIGSVEGALKNLRAEVEAGLLTSIEKRITSDVLADFIGLARASLERAGDGPKNVAAVLAAAAYEDTLRRMAGGSRKDLADVLVDLKAAGLLVAPQLSIAQSFLNFRNHALHANWDKIERSAVESVLGFVQGLVLQLGTGPA